MKKKFDCIDMKHKGAEKVQAMLDTMSIDEQVEYWERRGNELKKRQADIRKHRKAS